MFSVSGRFIESRFAVGLVEKLGKHPGLEPVTDVPSRGIRQTENEMKIAKYILKIYII